MNWNWSYGPETAKWGHDLCDLDLWPWPFVRTSLLSMVITPEKFCDDTITKNWIQIVNFWAHVTWKFDGRPQKTIGHLLYILCQTLCIISKPSGEFKLELQSETLNLGLNWGFFVPCELKIWQMTLKKKRAHPLFYFKLCASFHSCITIQNEAAVRKHQILVKIGNFF